jgi:hypothetical protein
MTDAMTRRPIGSLWTEPHTDACGWHRGRRCDCGQPRFLPWLMVTDLATDRTFVIEPARRNSRKLRASVMGARDGSADVAIAWRLVPLYIRRAAKAG